MPLGRRLQNAAHTTEMDKSGPEKQRDKYTDIIYSTDRQTNRYSDNQTWTHTYRKIERPRERLFRHLSSSLFMNFNVWKEVSQKLISVCLKKVLI